MNNLHKKGVSAVVANVLIILLVVVGVALIWAAVRPAIEEGAEGIQSDCITTSLEVVSCNKDVSAVSGVCVGGSCTVGNVGASCSNDGECNIVAVDGVVVIKRNAGGPAAIGGIKLIHTDSAGVSLGSSPIEYTGNIGSLASVSFNGAGDPTGFSSGTPLVTFTIATGNQFNVAAVIDGETCPVLSSPVTCT